jgi:hypothetical protein
MGINTRLEHALLEGFHDSMLHISKVTAQWPCSLMLFFFPSTAVIAKL